MHVGTLQADIHGTLKAVHGGHINEEDEVGLGILVVGIESGNVLEPLP